MHRPNLSCLSNFSTLQLVHGHALLSLLHQPVSQMPLGEMPKSLKLFPFSFLKIFIVDTIKDAPFAPPPPLCPPSPSSQPLPSGHHHTLCLWVVHVRSLANPFTFFHPEPPALAKVLIISIFLRFCGLVILA